MPLSLKALPNSAFLVRSEEHAILVHSPPETLKALLLAGEPLPDIILLPVDIPPGKEKGSYGFVHHGINFASVEFLLYANFFGKGRKTRILAPTQKQADRIKIILNETFDGPLDEMTARGYGQIALECKAVSYYGPIGRAPSYSDLCDIDYLRADDDPVLDHYRYPLDDGVTLLWLADAAKFLFVRGAGETLEIETGIHGGQRPLALAPAKPLHRQALTLQFIGGSDGFDPNGITTCFLAYLSQDAYTQATLFDTAAYLRERLGGLGLSANQVSEVVLSHLHEDHLAGLPELILMGEQRIRLITSDLIFESLLRVLEAMFDLSQAEIASLIDFYPLNPGRSLTIEDRTYEAIYAIHPVPTIAVRVNGLYYSGDMRYDEAWFEELVAEGVLSAERMERLITFAEGATIIVQDAGGGAVHTTITPELLEKLMTKGQRVVLAHTTEHKIETGTHRLPDRVEIASSGHITGHGPPRAHLQDVEILETVLASTLFSRLPFDDRVRLCRQLTPLHFKDGETIIADGEVYDGLTYLVHSGMVEIWSGAQEKLMLVTGRGSLFGERSALLTHKEILRSGMIVARGDAVLFSIDQDVFQPIAEQLGLHHIFERAQWLWEQLPFKEILWADVLSLALDFTPRRLEVGEYLFHAGDVSFECYLHVSGEVELIDRDRHISSKIERPCTFFGSRAVLQNELRQVSAIVTEPAEIWALAAADLQRLHMAHPGITLHLRSAELRPAQFTPK